MNGGLNYFEHTSASIGSTYRYRIRAHAVGAPWTQSSNMVEVEFSTRGRPVHAVDGSEHRDGLGGRPSGRD